MTQNGLPVIIPYQEFVETFRPISDGIVEGVPERPMFETFGADWERIRMTDPSLVWTIIEVDLSDGSPHPYYEADDDSCWLVVAGRHHVNRIGYMITELPWTNEFLETVYC